MKIAKISWNKVVVFCSHCFCFLFFFAGCKMLPGGLCKNLSSSSGCSCSHCKANCQIQTDELILKQNNIWLIFTDAAAYTDCWVWSAPAPHLEVISFPVTSRLVTLKWTVDLCHKTFALRQGQMCFNFEEKWTFYSPD